ncbi:MAG: acyl-CoA dehydrogenase family protein [Pseudomonadales bacterium]|nr:acyl-CoA dehydrogenase family protein [Pseudomonadales bacterium]MBO6565951.1 acyl-CoA dehydrogenase family protein [Pseudomonadales bacterium]MBO6595633.1 acyl-CoA dehydrogenase family protein [Pseudomonadales bacterium]MBO6655702.1 acyl-CoA dehydrogenase family protein [Pseudomonadales bacterium]MBO6820809.1 acyl-CoA dehydrogenase family protein [Pseudomonadales bacterium]
MRLQLLDEDKVFREEVREFLASHLDPEVSEKVRLGYPVSKEEQDDWTRRLNAKGWAAPNWPVEAGGPGWTMVRRHLFDIEMRGHHAPELQGFGFSMVGPAIIKYGTEEQKAAYLPKILNADISWCQGYSETGAGSDLATVSTRAIVDGDDYVVTGSKIWTSAAERADHIFMLVRTDPDAKPQLGISFLLADMRNPAVRVEPLMAFNGKRLWNQVFFDELRVPRSGLLGDENQGWTVAKNLLGNERLLVSRVAESRRMLSNVRSALSEEGISVHSGLAGLMIRLEALDATALRLLTRFDQGHGVGAEPSMLKLKGSQLVQDMDRMLYEVACYYGLPLDSTMREGGAAGSTYADMAASGMFHHRGYTIAGGTSEIQHNIIARQVLGL